MSSIKRCSIESWRAREGHVAELVEVKMPSWQDGEDRVVKLAEGRAAKLMGGRACGRPSYRANSWDAKLLSSRGFL